MILRRRDDYARVLRELGGELFATEGQVDNYFDVKPVPDSVFTAFGQNNFANVRIQRRVEEHIQAAPDCEAVALRVANTRQGVERLWRTR